MYIPVLVRQGTASQATANNKILRVGEFGYETDTYKLKIGRGLSWNNTPYLFENGQNFVGNLADLLTAAKTNAVAAINELFTNKVDKVEGMGLSSNDFTAAEKAKLGSLSNYIHPETHPATMIVEDTTHRFHTDAQAAFWSDKYTKSEVDNKIIGFAAGLLWKGAVVNFSDLATTYPAPENNWTARVTSEGKVYRYDTSLAAWTYIFDSVDPLATQSLDGNMSKQDKAKLDGIATGATKNATDAQLRDRGTHTGTQLISTVQGLQPALDLKVESVNQLLPDANKNVTVTASYVDFTPNDTGWWGTVLIRVKGAFDYLAYKLKSLEGRVTYIEQNGGGPGEPGLTQEQVQALLGDYLHKNGAALQTVSTGQGVMLESTGTFETDAITWGQYFDPYELTTHRERRNSSNALVSGFYGNRFKEKGWQGVGLFQGVMPTGVTQETEWEYSYDTLVSGNKTTYSGHFVSNAKSGLFIVAHDGTVTTTFELSDKLYLNGAAFTGGTATTLYTTRGQQTDGAPTNKLMDDELSKLRPSALAAFAATNTFNANKVMKLGGSGDVFNANHVLTQAASGNVLDTFLTVLVTGNGTNTITFGTGWQNENGGAFVTTNGTKNVIRMHYLDSTNKFYTITQPL